MQSTRVASAGVKDGWVAIGEIARPHGVRGELRVKLYDPESELLRDVEVVRLRLPGGSEEDLKLDGARKVNQAMLIAFEGLESIESIEKYRGAAVCVRREDFYDLEDGEYYFVDLVGGDAILDGKRFGEILEIREYPSVNVLVVKDELGKTWEVPMTASFVESIAAPNVVLSSIEGLDPS